MNDCSGPLGCKASKTRRQVLWCCSDGARLGSGLIWSWGAGSSAPAVQHRVMNRGEHRVEVHDL